jgi:hypothetical protein
VRYPGFINGSSALAAAKINAERTVNLFPERTAPGTSENDWWLRPTPGKRKLFEFPVGPVRNLFWRDGRGYALSGDRFYEFDAAYSIIQRGVVNSDTRPGTLVSNGAIGNQVFGVSGMAGFIFNQSTNLFSPISDPDFPGSCLSGAFADSYFLALYNGTPKFGFSALGNGLSWDALDVAQKSQTADNLVAMPYVNKELFLLGTETGEVWVNVGDLDNPWTPRPVLIEGGIAAQDSWADCGGALCWIRGGTNRKAEVAMLSGYRAVAIGSQAVHDAINGYSRIDDAIGYYYEDVGHKFYVLTFPTADHTWCYDLTTGIWHERLYWNSTNAQYEADLGRCHSSPRSRRGQETAGGQSPRRLGLRAGEPSPHNDAVDRRRRRDPSDAPGAVSRRRGSTSRTSSLDPRHGDGRRESHAGGQGFDPYMFMRYSDDGGDTWSTRRYTAMGKTGKTQTSVSWTRLGSARERVYEVGTNDPVFLGILNAYINSQPGIH